MLKVALLVLVWLVEAGGRLRSATRSHWRRILAGAAFGWILGVVGGAFALANLEFWGLVGPALSDDLGIVVGFACIGLGAIHAYRWRPRAR